MIDLNGSGASSVPRSGPGDSRSREEDFESFESLGLDVPAAASTEDDGERPRWRWIFWAMGIIVVYAVSMAAVVSYVLAFQHLRDLSG